jgi:hypothetical protein
MFLATELRPTGTRADHNFLVVAVQTDFGFTLMFYRHHGRKRRSWHEERYIYSEEPTARTRALPELS